MAQNQRSRGQLLAEVERLRAKVRVLEERTSRENAATPPAPRDEDPGKAAILLTALDAIISMDEDGCVTEFNPAAERIFGFRREELVGRPLADFIIPPTLRDAHRRGLDHFRATGSGPVLNRRIEIQALHADGTEFPVELAISPFRASGTWLFTAYVRDISERKAAERRLAAQYTVARILATESTLDEAIQQILRSVCETLVWDLGQFWRIDASGALLQLVSSWHASGAALASFAESCRSITFGRGVGLPGHVWSSGRAHWLADVREDPTFDRRAAAEQCDFHAAVAVPILHGDSLLGIMEFFGHRRLGPDNALLDMMAAAGRQLGQFMERKRAEEALRASQAQLAQAQKMEAIGQLAGGVAHDFNNLLTIVSGNGQLLMADSRDDDPARPLVTEILEAARRGVSLTSQLLTFSSMHAFAVKTVDLAAVVRSTEGMLRRLIGEDVILETRLDPDVGYVRADVGQLEQVIVNLAVNARDAMPRGGHVTISTAPVEFDAEFAKRHPDAKPGRYTVLAVADTGSGMDELTRSRAFEPFFTTKAFGKASGLGLSVVHGIVKRCGGLITVSSTPGRGTTVEIFLPRVDEGPSAGPAPKPGAAVSKGSETILLAEDDSRVRLIAQRALEAAGYTVLVAGHGGEALDVASHSSGRIHLLITDVIMPEMGGRQLAERLTVIRPDIKVLFMSGYSDDAVLRQGVERDEIAFLAKPFSLEDLTGKVRELLDQERGQSLASGPH